MLKNWLKSYKKGTIGVSLVTITEPKMNKRNNPLFGKVKKVSYITNAVLGISYENSNNAKLERLGKESNYEADKPKGMTWVMFPFVLCSDKDNSKEYLRYYGYKGTFREKSFFIVDGKIATQEETEIIRSFLVKSSPCKKQEECGIPAEKQLVTRSVTLTNVVYLGQGKNVCHIDNNNVLLSLTTIQSVFKAME